MSWLVATFRVATSIVPERIARIAGWRERRRWRAALLSASLLVSALVGVASAQAGPRIQQVRADPPAVDEGDVVALEVDADHPDDAPLRFGWTYGDGTRSEPTPHGARTFTVYLDDGSYEAVVRVEDGHGNVETETVAVTVRNVAPTIEAVDRTGAVIEKTELGFRARAHDPGDDALSYTWDFGDGTVLGPSRNLATAVHAYQQPGPYTLTLTVEDGDGGVASWTESILVGEGFRYDASGAVNVSGGQGESPYLMGLPLVRDGELFRFAGDMSAALEGDAAADAGARCFVSFGSRVPSIASGLEEGVVVRFTAVFPRGLREGTYPVAVVENRIPFEIFSPIEREWAAPETFFAHVGTLRDVGDNPQGESYHGTGGSVTVRTWEEGRLELAFDVGVEETQGPLDAIDGPGGLSLPPAPQAHVSGTFQHNVQRALIGREGSLNALAGGAYGDWYLCAPRDPLRVEEVVPDPDLADIAVNEVPVIDFEDPEIVIRFSEPIDMGSAVENAVLEWRRADGAFVEVPALVMGESDTTLRIAPLEDLMDGVVYRARVVGGLHGVQGRAGETLAEDHEWLFETILDLSEDRNGVTLATTQVARDAPLVADKPTETRVYLNWREKPQVHPLWQTRHAIFEVSVQGGTYAPQRVRVKRMDLYGAEERKHALDSVNFHGWRPSAAGSHQLTARVTQVGQTGSERSFEGSWTTPGYGAAQPLRIDYRFALVGSWEEGVPADARALGHRIARAGAVFTEQTFPVPHVELRPLGDVRIDEPDQPIVEAYGEQFFLASLLTVSRRDEDAAEAFLEQVGSTSADVVVMLVPPDVLRLSGFAYSALGNDPRVVAIKVDTGQADAVDYYASTVAHEVGHTFGLHHGTTCPDVTVCASRSRSDPIEGTRVAPGGAGGWNKSKWSGNEQVSNTPGAVLALMHPDNLPNNAVFITNENYARLQSALRARAAEPSFATFHRTPDGLALARVQATGTPGLYVSGWVDTEAGRAELTLVVPAIQPAGPPDVGDDALPLALEARDPSGTASARVPLTLLGADDPHAPGDGDVRPFVAFLPTTRATRSIAVVADGDVWLERVASEHAPVVAFDAAAYDVREVTTLAWTGADEDGDVLTYDLAYAADGRAWQTIAVGLRSSRYRVDPKLLAPGPAPAFRVTANDGFRSAASLADATVSSAPTVLVTEPAEGAVAPTHAALIVATLAPVEATDDHALSLERADGGGERVPGVVEPLPDGRGLRFVPAVPLDADTAYRATFGAGVRAVDGTPFEGELSWTFRTEADPVVRVYTARNLTGAPLASTVDEPGEDAADGAALPDTCAGIDRAVWAALIPAGAVDVSVEASENACVIAVASASDVADVRTFVERAILTNRFFLTSNRTDGDAILIGMRGQGLTGEASIQPGPPTRLRWRLQPE